MSSDKACLGVIGGGQLGMFFVQAARAHGHRTMVYDPDQDSPAGRFCHKHFCAAYNNTRMLESMAEACQAVTIEFENIPQQASNIFARRTFLAPSTQALEISRDRMTEKNFVRSIGLQTVNYIGIQEDGDIDTAFAQLSPLR